MPGNVSAIKGDTSQFGPNAPGYTWVLADEIEPSRLFPGITVKLLWQGDNGAKVVITTIEPGLPFAILEVSKGYSRRSAVDPRAIQYFAGKSLRGLGV